jgi:putative FmdB family regulatory protein
MPTYEYRCEACGHTFDIVQAFSDAALTTCDVCGGTLRKVYAPVGIVFKGSGFYKTDSRGSGSSRSTVAGTKEPSSGEAGSKDGTPTDTKAAPKESSSGSKESSSGSKESSSKDKKSAAPSSASKD